MSSTLSAILEAVDTTITQLSLSNCEEIAVRSSPRDQDGYFYPGITISPIQEREYAGTNEEDDIGYGVQVTMVVNDDNDLTEHDIIGTWRQSIRKAFIRQRLHPTYTVTDAATSGIGSTTLTSVTGGWTDQMVNYSVALSSGTNLTAGNYLVSAFTNTNTLELATSPDDGVGGVSGATAVIKKAVSTVHTCLVEHGPVYDKIPNDLKISTLIIRPVSRETRS